VKKILTANGLRTSIAKKSNVLLSVVQEWICVKTLMSVKERILLVITSNVSLQMVTKKIVVKRLRIVFDRVLRHSLHLLLLAH